MKWIEQEATLKLTVALKDLEKVALLYSVYGVRTIHIAKSEFISDAIFEGSEEIYEGSIDPTIIVDCVDDIANVEAAIKALFLNEDRPFWNDIQKVRREDKHDR